MGFVSGFYVEAKAFELSVAPSLGWKETRFFSSCVLLGKRSVVWLKTIVEALVRNTKVMEFIKLSRVRNKAFFVQRGSNRLGWYLEVLEYAVGGYRGLIVIVKGREGWVWRSFAAELRKVTGFFNLLAGELRFAYALAQWWLSISRWGRLFLNLNG